MARWGHPSPVRRPRVADHPLVCVALTQAENRYVGERVRRDVVTAPGDAPDADSQYEEPGAMMPITRRVCGIPRIPPLRPSIASSPEGADRGSDGAEEPRPGGQAAVEHQRRPGHEPGLVRGEVDRQVRDVIRGAEPAHGVPLQQSLLGPGLLVPVRAAGLGVDRAGADDVGTDGVGAVSDGDVPRQ